MTKILLLGASGQVGWELVRTLLPLGKIVAPDRARCDLAKPASLAACVGEERPDVIVNAAAYTAVDRAEEDPATAMLINGDAPRELALAARRIGALLVHYSTDYVFDGRKEGEYLEEDAAYPLNAYGRSKLAGEAGIRDSGAAHIIFRTSWVYAARGRNFLLTMLKLAAERVQLRVVADQFGAPTWSRLIAGTTAFALQQDLVRHRAASFESGTFNLTAAGGTSWHGFADAAVSGARQRGAPLACREIIPIATADYPTPARRPANSRLAGAALAARYGLAMPTWDECMQLCIAELYPGAA